MLLCRTLKYLLLLLVLTPALCLDIDPKITTKPTGKKIQIKSKIKFKAAKDFTFTAAPDLPLETT